MLEKFKKNIARINSTDEEKPKFLLAVSGGVDSCVLAHLFHASGITCSVAHCNFLLRGDDSHTDEQFVKKLSHHYGFDFHVKHFHTAEFAADNGISIQMAARQLRYQWFNELVKSHGYLAVAVAHHANDVAETMLINLTRGTGIAGMHGIQEVNGYITRPMLFATRTEIESYAKEHNLSWREDVSNSEDSYTRNKIRHHVMPVLNEINPNVVGAMTSFAKLMDSYEKLLLSFIHAAEVNLTQPSFGGVALTISIEKLLNYKEPELILYHILNKYGFNVEICKDILTNHKSGLQFLAPEYKLVTGRDSVYLFKTDDLNKEEEVLLNESDSSVELTFGTFEMFRLSDISPQGTLEKGDFHQKNTAYLNGIKLIFPLTIRRWRKGDYFYPLGMKGKKLISDYLIDEKFNPVQKELVYLLLSEQQVVWVIGHRIDDRFKLTESTSAIRKFEWRQKN